MVTSEWILTIALSIAKCRGNCGSSIGPYPVASCLPCAQLLLSGFSYPGINIKVQCTYIEGCPVDPLHLSVMQCRTRFEHFSTIGNQWCSCLVAPAIGIKTFMCCQLLRVGPTFFKSRFQAPERLNFFYLWTPEDTAEMTSHHNIHPKPDTEPQVSSTRVGKMKVPC